MSPNVHRVISDPPQTYSVEPTVLPMSSVNSEIGPSQPASRGTYEVKFLIDESRNQAVREWATTHLQPDPHSSPKLGYGYCVNSLYLDTPAFDVYHRGEGFRQRKYRLRRYGDEAAVWLELKRKNDGQVRKRRTLVPDADLPSKLVFPAMETWEGRWFQQRLEKLQLRPICQVTYQRFACVGMSINGPLRLTIDSHLHCQPASGWNIPTAPLNANPFLQHQHVLELKFREAIPGSFRGLIEDLRLTVASFSKYRQSVEACIPLQHLMGDAPPSDKAAG